MFCYVVVVVDGGWRLKVCGLWHVCCGKADRVSCDWKPKIRKLLSLALTEKFAGTMWDWGICCASWGVPLFDDIGKNTNEQATHGNHQNHAAQSL